MELDPRELGTLDLDDAWVPYVDLNDGGFLPTRVTILNDEYGFAQSFNIFGHSAVMPQAIRQLRAEGKKPIVIQRAERYYVFVSPP